MHLIDPDQLPEKERLDQATINNGLLTIERQRKPQIDLLDEPYCRSKVAWKVAMFSNAMAHRFISLADAVGLCWNNENAYWEFQQLLRKKVDPTDLDAIDALVMNYLFSTRDEEILKDHPELKARQVLSAIDLIDKTLIPHFRSHYDRLSERCHPNSLGHRALFSKLDRQTGIAAFQSRRDDSFVVPLKCALATCGMFKYAMDAIEDDVFRIANEHHLLRPSPLVGDL
jgi:hypothetical protein